MKYDIQLHKSINLAGDGTRIRPEDAKRQEITTVEVLKRLRDQPGLILADEVGMGKTFVAIATAVSVSLQKGVDEPVVIMVPNNILLKWINDFNTFVSTCITDEKVKQKLSCASAEGPIEFLKLLDDDDERRNSIIFLSHSGMNRRMGDKYLKLAFIQRALHNRKNINDVRRALKRFVGDLIGNNRPGNNDSSIYGELLDRDPSTWTRYLKRQGEEVDDDVIPAAILDILPTLDYSDVYDTLMGVPQRVSNRYDEHIKNMRRDLKGCFDQCWGQALKEMELDLPLLIFDEAHHLKNDNKGNKNLFGTSQSEDLANEAATGSLANVFDRMLFLTATPFQLGHYELCNVLRRFVGIRWDSIDLTKERYLEKIEGLNSGLDEAHLHTIQFQKSWGKLKESDLVVGDTSFDDSSEWWDQALETKDLEVLSRSGKRVVEEFRATKSKLEKAQAELKDWVIRHTKRPNLARGSVKRRERRVGQQTMPNGEALDPTGLPVDAEGIAPFLLASRASTFSGSRRAIYVEGLCSTFETFKNTRRMKQKAMDEDDSAVIDIKDSEKERLDWYLKNIEQILPDNKFESSMTHPKVKATVERTIDLWLRGEKVLIFCFYIQTGKILQDLINYRLSEYVNESVMNQLKCKESEVDDKINTVRNRLDPGEPFSRSLNDSVEKLLKNYKSSNKYKIKIQNVIRLYLRTDTSIARFVPMKEVFSTRGDYDAIVKKIMGTKDHSNLTFKHLLENFFSYLEKNSDDKYRNPEAILDSVYNAQTATRAKADTDYKGRDGGKGILPNIKRARGGMSASEKYNIMLTFNTPFLPDILVASSVMAEGMDLHLNCRHVIHHDLSWNPSDIEQRTGRVDRIGAKAEVAGKSIQVYYPYIAATQDEKMYKVVMDREQWFKVIMGEKVKIDQATIEREAARIPFPEKAAESLQFKLNVA